MARPFDIRDLPLLQRLHPTGRPLSTHLVVVGGINPLREAMRGYIAGAFDSSICMVEREAAPDVEAFGILQVLPDESGPELARQRGAGLILMAPEAHDEGTVTAWVQLSNDLAASAAERGVHHIVADVQEAGPDVAILQAAGFVPMLQQALYKLARPRDRGRAKDKEPKAKSVPGLRRATRDDEPLIRALHIRCAPRMTYQAEHSADALFNIMRTQRHWVLVQHNEVVGYVGFWHGQRGRAMRCLFKPGVEEQAEAVIRYVLSKEPYQRATYAVVRHYQTQLGEIFERMGYAHLGHTRLMLRPTAARVRTPVWSTLLETLAIPAQAVAKPVSYRLKSKR
jgi:hypothetical protein